MIVKAGQYATLRDGRVVFVTDVAEQDPDAYRYYNEADYDETGEFNVVSEMPVENIFVGVLFDGRIRGWSKDASAVTVVSDMSEVVSVR